MLELYYSPGSAASRLVLMTLVVLNLNKVTFHEVDLKGDQNQFPEILKLNPQHTIPTLIDDKFVLWESRAIVRYLVNKYGSRNDRLYPADTRARAVIDSRLDFDIGSLCPSFAQMFYPQMFFGTEPGEAQLKKLGGALSTFDAMLASTDYAAGPGLTIADLVLVATISTIDAAEIDLSPFPNITRWYRKVKMSTPGYKEANEKGLNEFKKLLSEVKKVSKIPEKELNQESSDNQGWNTKSENFARKQQDYNSQSENKPKTSKVTKFNSSTETEKLTLGGNAGPKKKNTEECAEKTRIDVFNEQWHRASADKPPQNTQNHDNEYKNKRKDRSDSSEINLRYDKSTFRSRIQKAKPDEAIEFLSTGLAQTSRRWIDIQKQNLAMKDQYREQSMERDQVEQIEPSKKGINKKAKKKEIECFCPSLPDEGLTESEEVYDIIENTISIGNMSPKIEPSLPNYDYEEDEEGDENSQERKNMTRSKLWKKKQQELQQRSQPSQHKQQKQQKNNNKNDSKNNKQNNNRYERK